MKRTIVACIITLTFWCCCQRTMAADSPARDDIRPDRTYATKSGIEAWASHAYGGHWVKTFKDDGKEVVVVFRSFTSGVYSTDLSFFVPNGNRWRLALWYPVRGENLYVEPKKGALEIRAQLRNSEESVFRMIITYDALFGK